MCEFLQSIKENNPDREIILILDNFPPHHAAACVLLPPYSPDLNIESVWKSIKK
ncbi:MAG: hypothetical protein MOIL_01507 [Candidatus Methanolliviera sp. GoM_oil]|nr:MAG: hypothetical protein MOIL_01507 [Candidatus Methanolliviera sp. GoM_oil]